MVRESSILLASVGNTRTAVALASRNRLDRVNRLRNGDPGPVIDSMRDCLNGTADAGPPLILVATVNRRVSDPLMARLDRDLHARVLRIGDDLPIPVGTCIDADARPGQDRLLNAAAAFDRFRQACVVIDAGTAVTIDFVDGEGTFHGGAIAPGAQMQLDALHQWTDALPALAFAAPDPEPFGPNTTQAMLQGVFHGIRGMVRHITERYAEAYRAYPAVIATGGDAHHLFDTDELVEHIVDDLTLHGMLAALRAGGDDVADDAAL